MDGAGLDDRTLRRIAALLAALAVLAERAAGRSVVVGWVVLTILRYAEGAARTYVVEVTQLEWPGFDEPLEPGCRPSDAALLAWRLRLLAAVLGALLPPEDRFGHRAAGHAGAARRRAACGDWLLVTPAGWAPELHDTS